VWKCIKIIKIIWGLKLCELPLVCDIKLNFFSINLDLTHHKCYQFIQTLWKEEMFSLQVINQMKKCFLSCCDRQKTPQIESKMKKIQSQAVYTSIHFHWFNFQRTEKHNFCHHSCVCMLYNYTLQSSSFTRTLINIFCEKIIAS
jgi:hypothetical protein